MQKFRWRKIGKEDKIDFQARVYLMKKMGDHIKVNETIAIFYSSKKINIIFLFLLLIYSYISNIFIIVFLI